MLERFCASAQERHQTCCGRQADPLKRVYSYVDGMIQLSQEGATQGCLLGTFAQELSDTNPQIRSLCAQAFGQWAKALQRDLSEAKAAHAPKAAFEPKSLAEYIIAVVEGALILAKAKQDPRVVKESLSHVRRYLEQLFRT